MANGVSMYGVPNADPRYVNDTAKHHNLVALSEVDAIMGEHTAAFECINSKNNSFKMETVAQDLDALIAAAKFDGGSKAVFVQTWPGMCKNACKCVSSLFSILCICFFAVLGIHGRTV